MNETELLQAYRLILDLQEVALKRGDEWGFCDCIDNCGNPYPSQWAYEILRKARAMVDDADGVANIEEMLAESKSRR